MDKVRLAAFHLLDEAQLWFYQVELDRLVVDWEEFKELCMIWFRIPAYRNPLGDLVLLRQVGLVEAYQPQFQEKLARASHLVRRDQHVNLFTVGLNYLLNLEVELHAPNDLGRAMNLVRAMEARQHTHNRGSGWQGGKNYSPSVVGPPVPPPKTTTGHTMASTTRTNNSPSPYIRKLTGMEMADRRAKNLCYNCDKIYRAGHQCKRLFWLELEAWAEEEKPTEDTPKDVEPEISLHAIIGQKSAKTMQVRAKVIDQSLVGLVDSGSTHNFLSVTAAKHLRLGIQPHPIATVSVANGEKVLSYGVSKDVQFSIGNTHFTTENFLISLAGFDIVLGVKWLQTLGPILWDFSALTMNFVLEGKPVQLRGSQASATPHVHLLHEQQPPASNMDKLLEEFTDLFWEPSGLPPLRHYDHQICLKSGSHVVVVRPYKYPHLQKDEIEQQCKTMLEHGLIRSSHSSFCSLVILVKKHDGTWRFCVDYRELNAKTIKDKFSILVVDELLDELHGSTIFTKLDLRSGYHQIRMHLPDI
ncbi:uncharacterized protein [Aristolochia californica]|uniref:uncharacterized protein n=1 Tax=Aristolochia californica TaxID=171875 RepID=UPI0035DD6455